MWLIAMMTPPSAGMCSRPRQSRFVSRYSNGWMSRIAKRYQKPSRPRRMVRVSRADSGAVEVAPHRPRAARIVVMSAPECDRGAVDATSWSVVIPVKLLSTAKTRLQGFDPADREALALAMALDTIAAVLAC